MTKYNIQSILDFLKSSHISNGEFKSTPYKYKMFFKLFLINLLIVVLLSIVTGFLRLKFNISFKEVDLQLPMIWLLNLTMIPVLEEIAFRLPLIYKKNNIVLSFSAITYFTTSLLLADGALDISTNIYLRLIISVVIGVVIFFLLSLKSIENKISKFWETYSKLIFYVLLLLFTLGHIENYILTSITLLLMPILLLPQFIGGVFLSFIRTKFGFEYAILFHILINLFAFGPQIIMYLIH